VGRFLRALRWQGSAENTLTAYEGVLAWLAIEHDDFASIEEFASPLGVGLLDDFLDRRWGSAARATKKQRLAVIRSFFRWAAENGRISHDPTARSRRLGLALRPSATPIRRPSSSSCSQDKRPFVTRSHWSLSFGLP
jgi:site-specific recombinase XerD